MPGWRGAGDQNDAVGLAGHTLPAAQVIAGKAQLVKVLEQHIGVENPHYHLFAERSGQGREAQFHFAAIRRRSLDPTVLRLTLFRDVHPSQAFQAADHRHGDL